MENKYEKPEVKVIIFDEDDIVMTSGASGVSDDNGAPFGLSR